jgi:hypothetical protein
MKMLLGLLFSAFVSAPALAVSNYDKIVTQMRALETQYPAYAKVYSIGQNDDGIDILAMRVSVTPDKLDTAKVGHLVVGTHHGNEIYAPAFTMFFLRDLIQRYAATPTADSLKTREYTIVPVLNIDGYNHDTREEHNVDPNRDYPSPCLTQQGGSLKSIRLAMGLFDVRSYVGTVTVHGYDGSLSYPWGIEADSYTSKDQDKFAAMFEKAVEHNHYRAGTSGDMIYPANGTFEDWTYWKHGAWSMLIELRDGAPDDIADTTRAVATYFDELDSSPLTSVPSDANQFLAQCERRHNARPRLE